MQVLDTSIANVALRQIAGSLGAGADESTWIVTTYLVASAIIIPISGWLSAVIGRKRYYMICVALFTKSPEDLFSRRGVSEVALNECHISVERPSPR